MKVKVGDKVKVIAGSNKGKEGKVIATFAKENRVVVEGVNIVKKHVKPNGQNETGGIQEKEAPIHVSNVKVIETVKKEKKAKTTKAVKETKATKKVEETAKEEKPAKKAVKKTTKKAQKED